MPPPIKLIPQAIETAEKAAENLAKYLSRSHIKERLYHITPEDFTTFKPGGDNPTRSGPAIWLTTNKEFQPAAHRVSYTDEKNITYPISGEKAKFKTGTNVMPVYAQANKPLVLDDPTMIEWARESFAKGNREFPELMAPNWVEQVKKEGYDSVIFADPYKTGQTHEVIVFEPTQIKSAIGNRGTYDPTKSDIRKARGGQINPIKSPREMLFEMAGIPSFAKGESVGKFGAEMYKLITQAIERYTKTYGKPPSPEDVKALKDYAKQLSVKSEIKTDLATQARARHQMATDPNLINPEGPDPFLMKQMTGRTVKGNWQAPKPLDISNPQVMQNIEAKQSAGALDEILPESITPSADYMARMSKGIENEILGAGKIPLIDKLKASFFAKHKRYPTDEELEIIIAEFNPARHQYGEKGAAIVTERPPTAKGMADWRQKARMEGIPESYLEKQPADYPKYLKDELELSKGVQPGTKPLSDQRINPDRQYADGRSVAPMTPAEMQSMMIAYGKTPSNLMPKEPMIEKLVRGAGVPFATMAAHSAGKKLEEGDPYEAALYGASAVGSAMSASRRYMKPGLAIAGGAAVPLSVDEAIRRYRKGDRTGAVISAIEAAGNAAAMYPPTAVPGSVISFGAGLANAFRGEPEYKSVMEDYK